MFYANTHFAGCRYHTAKWLGIPENLKGTELPRFVWEGPLWCTMYYFILAHSGYTSKPILCFTHSQDGKKGNKNITKTFARLHNHCPLQGIQFRTANAGASSGYKRFDTGPSLLAMVMLALL